MRAPTFLLVLIFQVLAGATAWAESGLPYVGHITRATSEEVSLFVLPDGSGPALTQAETFGGQVVDGSIVVGLVDDFWNPIVNFPREDIWLESETPTGAPCSGYLHGGFISDMETNIVGETFFATSLAGGGWSEGPLWVYLIGDRAMDPDLLEHPPVLMRFNSADINNDGQVNLSDLALFSSDYFVAYQYRSDFSWDGVLDLVDVGKFATGYGLSCN